MADSMAVTDENNIVYVGFETDQVNQSLVAKPYDNTRTYHKGELILENDELLECQIEMEQPESYVAAHWKATDISSWGYGAGSMKVVRDNPEYLYAITDANGVFLFGIKRDASIEWAVGVPQPVKDWARALVTASIASKVDKEEGKSLISERVANSIVPESFNDIVFEIKDNDGKNIIAVTSDANIISDILDDYTVQQFLTQFNLKFVQTTDYTFALIDADNKILLGLDNTGRLVDYDWCLFEIISRYFKNTLGEDFVFSIVSANGYKLFSIDRSANIESAPLTAFVKNELKKMNLTGDAAPKSYVDAKVSEEETRAKIVERDLQEQIDSIEPTIVEGGTNNPDEYYLTTNASDAITLKNLSNLVYVNSISDFTTSRCTYVIDRNLNLGGAVLNMPPSSTLVFRNGSMSNGVIHGDDTDIKAYRTSIFTDVTFSGTWICQEIHSSWLSDAFADGALQKLTPLLNDMVWQRYIIDPGTYQFTPTTGNRAYIILASNTSLVNNGTIQINANGEDHYYVFRAINKQNLDISGGELIGDVSEHNYSSGGTHEWCMGIRPDHCTNVCVHNMLIHGFPGDGIETDGDNQTFRDLTIYHCGRQGISVLTSSNITIDHCIISDIFRTAPCAAIDIEPYTGVYAHNINVSNIVATGTSGIQVLYATNVNLCNIKLDNPTSHALLFRDTSDVTVNNVEIHNDNTGLSLIHTEGVQKNVVLSNVSIDTTVSITVSVDSLLLNVTDDFHNDANITVTGSPTCGSTRMYSGVLQIYKNDSWTNL